MEQLENVERALVGIGQQVVDELRLKMKEKNAKGYDKVATGNLSRSLETTTGQTGEIYNLDLHHLPYFNYVEYDTRPHFPPVKPILAWVRDKKIPTVENTGNKKLPTEKQVAYMTVQKIGREGTEGTGFLRTMEIENFYKWKKEIAIAQMMDVKNFVDQPTNKINIKLGF